MKVADCNKCHDTPCQCGYYWRNMDTVEVSNQIVDMLGSFSREMATSVLNYSLDQVKKAPAEKFNKFISKNIIKNKT